MNKTLLKSVAVLGLATTALSTAQPVGAIVNRDYTKESEKLAQTLNPYKSDSRTVSWHYNRKKLKSESYLI